MAQTIRNGLLRDGLAQDSPLHIALSQNDLRHEDMLRDLEHGLHDLCQPLTTLQCRLELGQIVGDKDSLREAVDGSLGDMANVFRSIAEMRERLAEHRERRT